MPVRSIRLTLLSLVAAAVVLAASAPSALAFKGLVTVTGTVQGPIQGDATGKDLPGAIVIRAMSFGLERESSDFPTAPQPGPFKMVKEPDRATPKLLLAGAAREPLGVEIRWYRTVSTGAVQHYFTVKLTNARIRSINLSGDVTVAGGVFEEISLEYDKLLVKDEINGTTAEIQAEIQAGEKH